MAVIKNKDWFKIKGYPHIGIPPKHDDRYKWIQPYVTNAEKIASHSFLPFIHKISKVRKFRKTYSKIDGRILVNSDNGKQKNRIRNEKKRELYYASHFDSLIFSYYAQKLGELYEQKVVKYNMPDIATAYRTIPCTNTTQLGNKCNIDFANDVFEFINKYPYREFVTITFDIKGFFDELDHRILKEKWLELLKDEEQKKFQLDSIKDNKLPPDHYNVYKNITRFAYVDLIDLFNTFKGQIITQKRNNVGIPGPRKKKKILKIRFLRNQGAIAFCSKNDFLKVKSKLVRNKRYIKKDGKTIIRNFGIPQGSPISSVLANIYMIDFDKKINDYVESFRGLYRRYSDDMVVVAPMEFKDDILQLMSSSIEDICLQIQPEKTQVFHFVRDQESLICGQEFNETINWNKNLIYLGFEFDGETVFLKSASLSGYYRKMKRHIHRSKFFAKHIRNKTRGTIFKRRILKKYTFLGAKRRRIWKLNRKNNTFKKTDRYDWGNFISYAYKAANVMMNNKIKQQTRKHWNKVNSLIRS